MTKGRCHITFRKLGKGRQTYEVWYRGKYVGICQKRGRLWTDFGYNMAPTRQVVAKRMVREMKEEAR